MDRGVQACAQVRRDTRDAHGRGVISTAPRVQQSLLGLVLEGRE